MKYYYPIKDLNTLTKILEVVPQETFSAIFVDDMAYLSSKTPFKGIEPVEEMSKDKKMMIHNGNYMQIPFGVLMNEFIGSHSRMVRDMAVKTVRSINNKIIQKVFEEDQEGLENFAKKYNEILESDSFLEDTLNAKTVNVDVDIDALIKEVFGGQS